MIDGNYWQKNLSTLIQTQPELAEKLENHSGFDNIHIVEAASGDPVGVVKGISLHSRRDPWAEAEKFCQTQDVRQALKSGKTIYMLGLDFGYHVLEMLKTVSRAHVFEPDLSLIKAALTFLDWTDALTKVTIHHQGPVPNWVRGKGATVVHRPSQRLNPHIFENLLSAINGKSRIKNIGPVDRAKTIIIVTPIRGGSLPTAFHSANALQSLGHRVITADMSSLDNFYAGMQTSRTSEMQKTKAADRMLRFIDEYLIMLIESEKPDLVLALAQAPLDVQTLGHIKNKGVPTAFWFVEDYRLMTYFSQVAPYYDFFFHIQGDAMEEELKKLGAGKFKYLPLAADPDTFKPLKDKEKLSKYNTDLSFMGAGYPNRRTVFEQLLNYDLKIWGTEWDLTTELGKRVQDNGRRIPTEETVLIYNAASININLHSSVFEHQIDFSGGFINPRTFEIASCAAFQLVDRRTPLFTHFKDEEEISTFASLEELREKTDFYLKEPELRLEIGLRARNRILSEHTFQHRMNTMLEFMHSAA